ncbi:MULTISPECIES: hypothetical protein [unclassified Frankia]|uniref:hypothetical protein n=1 Tax=unclassified Frankia TaxID=2632575 RepID=UPI002024E5B8
MIEGSGSAVQAHLFSSPRLLLLDEVSMGLALAVVDEIFAFLDLLAQEGSSLLLVERYVTRVLARGDYVYLLNRGQARFVGELTECESSDIFKERVDVD